MVLGVRYVYFEVFKISGAERNPAFGDGGRGGFAVKELSYGERGVVTSLTVERGGHATAQSGTGDRVDAGVQIALGLHFRGVYL